MRSPWINLSRGHVCRIDMIPEHVDFSTNDRHDDIVESTGDVVPRGASGFLCVRRLGDLSTAAGVACDERPTRWAIRGSARCFGGPTAAQIGPSEPGCIDRSSSPLKSLDFLQEGAAETPLRDGKCAIERIVATPGCVEKVQRYPEFILVRGSLLSSYFRFLSPLSRSVPATGFRQSQNCGASRN
jgi:hypothetical protein